MYVLVSRSLSAYLAAVRRPEQAGLVGDRRKRPSENFPLGHPYPYYLPRPTSSTRFLRSATRVSGIVYSWWSPYLGDSSQCKLEFVSDRPHLKHTASSNDDMISDTYVSLPYNSHTNTYTISSCQISLTYHACPPSNPSRLRPVAES